MTSLLSVQSISKSFGGLKAVSDVSLSIPKGSIFGLIGPNGAGKTTVFNLVTGVYTPDQGTIRLGDTDLVSLPPARIAAAGVARTFQNIRLFGQLSVLENLLVACELRKTATLWGSILHTKAHVHDETTMRKKALDLLEAFSLLDVANEPSTSLPYGNQRRLEICRAMMLDPKILLLDEPAAGMNYGEAEGLQDQIRWLRKTFDVTVVLVEHNMQVVMGVCEEIQVLDHGEPIAKGTPEEIRQHPKVHAAYLGDENLVIGDTGNAEGEVVRTAGASDG